MPLSILSTTTPYHLVSYGALLGTTMYQSFIAGPVAFKALDLNQFGLLQSRIFPVFFRIQAALPIVIGITYPFSTYEPLAIGSFLASTLLPLINIAFVSPLVNKRLTKKKILEEAEGTNSKSKDASDKLKLAGKQFGRAHGLSMIINLLTMASNLSYVLVLATHVV